MSELTAPDPGNLPARMAEVIASHEWTEFPRSAHNQHNYYAECAVCQRDILRMAEVALGVRDELVAHLSARAAKAEAWVGHAEAGAQLSSERLAKVRQELAEAVARADKAEAAVRRGLALSDEYATHHPDWRPLATQTAVVFCRALTGEGDKRWLAGLEVATLTAPVEGTTTPARETA